MDQLLVRIANGDESAFSALFSRYRGHIYRIAYKLFHLPFVAEDIVQEVFAKVWIKRHELPAVKQIDNYLFIITRNHIHSELKKRKVRQQYAGQLSRQSNGPDLTPEDQFLYKESATLLYQSIQLLPRQQQLVYELIKERGVSRKEAAAELGISSHTVHNHMTKAMSSIRQTYRYYGLPALT
jgi:RNA polymerase sigma-70 factor (family 1)